MATPKLYVISDTAKQAPTRFKFTDTRIAEVQSPKSGQRFYWDSDLAGFGLRVTPGSKSFIVERKVRRKTCRLTVGSFSILSADAARRKAMQEILLMCEGINPRQHARQEALKEITLQQVFDEFIAGRPLKASTLYDYGLVFPWAFGSWKNRRLTDITKEKVLIHHKKLGEKSKARANLAMRLLRTLFNYAAAKYDDMAGDPIIKYNPVKVLSQTKAWFPVKRRRTFIKPGDMPAWFAAVLDLANQTPKWNGETVRDFLILLIFTGFRRNEALTLKWSDVDLDSKAFNIKDTKNGSDHSLPIPFPLQGILKQRLGNKDGDYVFSGTGELGYMISPGKQMKKVIEASGVKFTPHDLRRTFITVAANLGVPTYALKRLLNHSVGAHPK
jgi:integrase